MSLFKAMKPSMSAFLSLVFLELLAIASITISFSNGGTYVGCLQSGREALLRFKHDLNDSSNCLSSMVGDDGDCYKWAAVVSTAENNRPKAYKEENESRPRTNNRRKAEANNNKQGTQAKRARQGKNRDQRNIAQNEAQHTKSPGNPNSQTILSSEPLAPFLARLSDQVQAEAFKNFSLVISFSVLAAATFNISFCNGSTYVGCLQSEREALLRFKQDLNDSSNRLASWSWIDDHGDCCKCAAVVCNNFRGHVLELHLGNPFSDQYYLLVFFFL
ncbi:hypothetical protein Dsin_023021 [Dipteronia sinensis]|uniref:Leucine-rich repeat-containing N-terminal plant-type domain-containing protein n=1 Tax=Dipteronia sinensis TaxID=43782 RepID=A0AAE0A3Z1_9ROSI|nr:hypothetical protein Dsin_023021 [Dipteronia sinensis]